VADGYHIDPAAVGEMADAIGGLSGPLGRLAGPWQQVAGAIDTGDTGLNGETAAVAGQFADLMAQAGQVVRRLSGAVNTASDNYQSGDQRVAASYQELSGTDTGTAVV
jgi:predicted Zn-dependent protease